MTNNKQQTAVEFYLDKVFDIIGDAILDKLSIEQINKIHDLSLQAKEMEKEQSQAYAAFCVGCDRKKLPLLEFDGWVKLGDEQ